MQGSIISTLQCAGGSPIKRLQRRSKASETKVVHVHRNVQTLAFKALPNLLLLGLSRVPCNRHTWGSLLLLKQVFPMFLLGQFIPTFRKPVPHPCFIRHGHGHECPVSFHFPLRIQQVSHGLTFYTRVLYSRIHVYLFCLWSPSTFFSQHHTLSLRTSTCHSTLLTQCLHAYLILQLVSKVLDIGWYFIRFLFT